MEGPWGSRNHTSEENMLSANYLVCQEMGPMELGPRTLRQELQLTGAGPSQGVHRGYF